MSPPKHHVTDEKLRTDAARILDENRRGDYTVPALGLYPYQWCWDSGPIALGWAAQGDWAQAWGELDTLMTGQWDCGMVPHIIFWHPSDDYFPGPDVWGTRHEPPSTGLTQPPLPVTAAAALARLDPDQVRAVEQLERLWPRLTSWIEWIARARRGPHGAAVIVHPWESGMDNSPSWDIPLEPVEEVSHEHLKRRDTATVAAPQRPTNREYRKFLGIVKAFREHGWDTEQQGRDSPFAVEDPAFTAITSRAAADLAGVAPMLDLDPAPMRAVAEQMNAGLAALWDEDQGWFRPYDMRASKPTGPVTASGLIALWSGGATKAQAERIVSRLREWDAKLCAVAPTTDPAASEFEPERYWRGPVWVIINWMASDGLLSYGYDDDARRLRAATRELVARDGFCEYYNPETAQGMGGQGFSWTAALTLAWLTT